jgi:hypothetical protein
VKVPNRELARLRFDSCTLAANGICRRQFAMCEGVARSSWPILLSTHHRAKSTPGFTNIRIHCLTLSNPFGAHYYVKLSSLREGGAGAHLPRADSMPVIREEFGASEAQVGCIGPASCSSWLSGSRSKDATRTSSIASQASGSAPRPPAAP